MISGFNWPVWGSGMAWAPEIHLVDGMYVVYFSLQKDRDRLRGIGFAKSHHPFGPFHYSDGPIIESPFGSIDCHCFKDPK